MPRLPNADLSSAFLRAIRGDLVSHSSVSKKPLDVDLDGPVQLRLRVYLYTLTAPPGGRTPGEHKIQLIVPKQNRKSRGNFDISTDRQLLLVGYDPAKEVFILWDAGLYSDFPFSMNVQVTADTVFSAEGGSIVNQTRKLHSGETEIVTAAPSYLLRKAIDARLQDSLKTLLELAK